MKKENKFSLIEGTFTPDEAKDILMSLVYNKIQFYKRKNFSLQIRKGNNDEYSLNKKNELEKIRQQILDQIDNIVKKNQSIEILCSVDIKFK